MVRTQKLQNPRTRQGFSLVEVLVVVMVILVIAAIAIPNLVASKMKANEAAAVASMRTIQTAETMYAAEFPDVGYASSLVVLGPNGSDCSQSGPSNACIIMDETLVSGLKNGYIFEIAGDGNTPTRTYSVTASPQSSSMSGRCSFTSNQGGGITASNGAAGGRFAIGAGGSGGCGN